MWYRCTMEFYPAIKKSRITKVAVEWMGLEIITLSEVTQARKDKYHMFSLICRSQCLIFMYVCMWERVGTGHGTGKGTKRRQREMLREGGRQQDTGGVKAEKRL